MQRRSLKPNSAIQEKTLPLGFAAVAIAILITIFFVYRGLHRVVETDGWVNHTNQVRAEIFALQSAVRDAQRGVRGYIITRQPESLQAYEAGRQEIPAHLNELQTLTKDNQRQQERVKQLRPLIDSLLAVLAREINAVNSGNTRSAAAYVIQGSANHDINAASTLLGEMQAEEESLLRQREQATATSTLTANVSFGVAAALTLLILAGVFVLISRNELERDSASRELQALHTEVQKRADELEIRVRERTRQLQEVNASLEAFSYSVSHDLRAPLRGISGLGTALVEDYAGRLDDRGKQYLRAMIDSVRKMDTLIDQLLAYSRVTKHSFIPKPVSIKAVFTEAWEQLRVSVQETGAVMRVDERCGCVRGSETLLTQSVANLLANAIKFVSPGRKPEIAVSCSDFGDRIRVSIKDNGIGIALSDQQRIFAPFERLHGSETYSGTGIGLAIVRTAVERMSGKVGVESQPGQGSRFWIELPKAEESR